MARLTEAVRSRAISLEDARAVLDAVAPVMEARALRAHADRLDSYDHYDDMLLHVRRIVRDMRDRADQISPPA